MLEKFVDMARISIDCSPKFILSLLFFHVWFLFYLVYMLWFLLHGSFNMLCVVLSISSLVYIVYTHQKQKKLCFYSFDHRRNHMVSCAIVCVCMFHQLNFS